MLYYYYLQSDYQIDWLQSLQFCELCIFLALFYSETILRVSFRSGETCLRTAMLYLLYFSCLLWEYLVFAMYVQIIGRTDADPDYVPRSRDYGLNVAAFRAKYAVDCLPQFFDIAVACCQINPENRFVAVYELSL